MSNYARKLWAVSAIIALTGCSSASPEAQSPVDAAQASSAEVPAWCGDTPAVVGFADGAGSNSWKRLNRAEIEDEVSRCPSVEDFIYLNAQGDTQKAVSDINSLVAQGATGILVFPDAGEATLPAIRNAYRSGATVVPYRVSPGGMPGEEYTTFVASSFPTIGELWGKWLVENLPEGGNVLFLGGPPANSQNLAVDEGLQKVLQDHPEIEIIGDKPFTVTNWNPAQTQQVTATMINKYPKIDAVIADFAATSIISAFEQSGRDIPLIATADVNGLSCKYQEKREDGEPFQLMTVNSQTSMGRLAAQHAIAGATGGQAPAATEDIPHVFEDSVSGAPQAPSCDPALPEDAILSGELSKEQVAEVLR